VPENLSNKSFGAKVRGLRDQLGMSQEKLGELAGLHRTYISDVERGARNLSLNSIKKLATALGVSAATLLTGSREVLPGKLIEILLVEDDMNDVELTLAALRSANLVNRVHVVHDGAAALSYLAGFERQPKVDGLEVLRQIKANPRTRAIPVVVLTISSRSKDISACKQLGAEGYIVKPVDIQNFCGVTPGLSLQWALLARPAEATA